ncbi:hypothetical protein OH76DRAFT_724412 [Lentinus brumalis]|uniref:Uncharacterized protein n=1 Tax=Lentinus brumalis TaxID=2498619 RepID=A0A371D572_9APHY|nr:hypothetical protein OH76DRAFT_724412 [Polyporus brumalis]
MTWRCVDALQRFPSIRLAIADSLSRNRQGRWVPCRNTCARPRRDDYAALSDGGGVVRA